MTRAPLLLITAACAALMTGCALHEPPADRSVVAPAAWHTPDTATHDDANDRIRVQWWQSFGNTDLDHVVSLAASQSYDVAAAVARVKQAEATARIAGAPLLPQLAGYGTASREGRIGGQADVAGTTISAGLSVSYEIDFWGANRAARDSALASLRASAYARDTVLLTVTAGAANLWLQTAGTRERLGIARQQRDMALDALRLIESQARAGSATALDVAQQRGLVATQERSVAALEQQAVDSENALAILLGQHLGDVTFATAPLASLATPSIAAGMPSTLLARRPDIAQIEAELAAADANVLVARAQMLPSVTLTGQLGLYGEHLHTLLESPIYSVAAALAAPIFDGGTLAGTRDLRRAQREELLATYRSTIVSAFGDVESALNAVAGLDRQIDAQQRELAQARLAFRLTQSRYRAGAETMLTLLDTQRTLFAAQDLQVQLRQARLQASVTLYKALGGGWQMPATRQPPSLVGVR